MTARDGQPPRHLLHANLKERDNMVDLEEEGGKYSKKKKKYDVTGAPSNLDFLLSM